MTVRLLFPVERHTRLAFTYERIDKDNAALLVIDHQEGLYQISRDQNPIAMKNNILAHAALGKIFNLPTVLTTSAETGKQLNGVLWLVS